MCWLSCVDYFSAGFFSDFGRALFTFCTLLKKDFAVLKTEGKGEEASE